MSSLSERLRAFLEGLPAFDERAVLFALIASWIVGWVWYGIAGQLWRESFGENKVLFSPRRQIVASMSQVVMTIVLAMLVPRLGPVTMLGGIKTALLIWIGFVLPTVLVNYSNLGARLTVTLIDGLHWLFVLLAMGLVIGLMSTTPGTAVAPAAVAPAAAVTAPATGTAGAASGTSTGTGTGATGSSTTTTGSGG